MWSASLGQHWTELEHESMKKHDITPRTGLHDSRLLTAGRSLKAHATIGLLGIFHKSHQTYRILLTMGSTCNYSRRSDISPQTGIQLQIRSALSAGSNGRSAQVGVQGRGAIKYQHGVTHAPQTAAIVSFAARPPHFRGDESPTHRTRPRERARKAQNMNEFTSSLQPNFQIRAIQASVTRTFTLISHRAAF
ncbi:hypothetical protein SRHO_G00139960 [Serrasalmus rhombeus]